MKKAFTTIILVTLAVTAASGEPVSKSQAALTAKSFLKDRGHDIETTSGSGGVTRSIQSVDDGSQPYYVFNATDGGGFVIVSGESSTKSVVGYADEGTFSYDDAPEGLKAMLTQYAEQVSQIQSEQAATLASTDDDAWAEVEPLVKTTWYQLAPYNYYMQPNRTGCMATAISQLMYYWQWPRDACSEIPAYSYSGISGYEDAAFDALPSTTFDWDAMQESYVGSSYDEDPTHAVGTLMQYVGHAVEMTYGTHSGAYSYMTPVALTEYFDYDSLATCTWRDCYSNSEWHSMIYHELANGRPVEYHAHSDAGVGHSFICDGYQDGYYHINWGWGGDYNGYFLLELMETGSGGIGGYGTYTYMQGAVVNIAPEGQLSDPLDIPTAKGMYYGSNFDEESGDSSLFVVYILHYGTETPQVGLAVTEGDTSVSDSMLTASTAVSYGANAYYVEWPTGQIAEALQATGKSYTLTPVYYDSDTEQWADLIDDGRAFEMTFDGNGEYSVSILPKLDSTIVEFVSASEEFFVNMPIRHTFNFTNPNDCDVNYTYYLYAMEDGVTTGYSVMQVYLSAGETGQTDFYYTPTEPCAISFVLYNDNTGEVVWDGATTHAVSYILTLTEYSAELSEDGDTCTISATFHNNSSEDLSGNIIVYFGKPEDESLDNYKHSTEDDDVITGGGDLTQHYSIPLAAYGYAEGDTIVAEFCDNDNTMLTDGTVEFVLGQDATGMQPAAAHGTLPESGKAYTVTGVPAPEGYRGVIITAGRKKVVR